MGKRKYEVGTGLLTVPITDATRLWGSVLGRKSDTVVDWAALSPMARVSPKNVYGSILTSVK
jgi:hypothetical protein